MVKKLLEHFIIKNYKKQFNKDLRYDKKWYDNSFISWIDKKKLNWMKLPYIKMDQYLLKPYKPFGGDINVKLVCPIMQQKLI